MSAVLYGKGLLAFARGNLDEARRWHEEALGIDVLVSRDEVSQDHYVLARVCAAQGDVAALTAYAGALEATAAQGETYARVHLGLAAGWVALAEGRLDDADPLFLAAIDTLASVPIVESVADALKGVAACATARGDPARASNLADLAAGLRDGSRSIDSVAEIIA